MSTTSRRMIVLPERRREWVAAALRAEEEVVRLGSVHDGGEVLAWFQSRLEGRAPDTPPAHPLHR